MTKSFKFWLSKHSLRFKLSISILTCVCLAFLNLAFLISRQTAPILAAQLNDSAKKSVEVYVTNFSHLATDAERVILNTKNTLSEMSEDNVEGIKVLLSSAIKTVYDSDLSFLNAWLYTFPPENVSSGTLYISTDHKDTQSIDFESKHISNLYDIFPWFKEVPKEEKIYWSEPYLDKETQKTVFTCLIPFKFISQTDFNGLFALTIDLSDIEKRINDFSFYETGKLILLSRSGLYVTYPEPGVALKKTIFELSETLHHPELKVIGNNLAAGISGTTTIPKLPIFKGKAIFFYAPIKNLGWSFCLVYAAHEFFKPIRQSQIIIFISLLISVLLLIFIINWICRHATKQLFTISDIAAQYGCGDFSESFNELPTSSDVGRLANALSNMRTNLLDYISRERTMASEKQRAQSELDIARHIQTSALSTKYPENDAFEIATMMIPARKVGGDFYDFFFIDENKFAVVVADVSGKGIPAALYMMKALTLIKNISKSKKSLDFVFHHVNEQLCEGNDTCMFVTAFMAVIDLISGETKYVNAGHNPPLIGTPGKYHFMQPKRNIILGINPNATFVEETMHLDSDMHLFLYTDGVTEAENAKSKFYGEDRLLKILNKATETPKDNLDIVLKDLKKFVKNNPQSDDITMLDFVFHGKKKTSLILPADIKKIKDVIDFLKKDMQEHNLSEKAQFNMVMASEEIFSNIAMYAYETKENALATVLTSAENGFYYITFIDNGKKYNPLKAKEPDMSLEMKDRNVGGLGIFLAKKLSDTLTYSYKNKQNILVMGIAIDK